MMYVAPHYIGDTWLDYPDTESQAVEVFMQGCTHACPSCQNISMQAVYKGHLHFTEIAESILFKMKAVRTNKIVFVGGEPLLKANNNLAFIKDFLNCYGDKFDVCIYTGFDKQYCLDNNISNFTFLKTGKYLENKKQEVFKTTEAMQFASPNQALYDRAYNLLTTEGKYTFKEKE